MKYANEAIALSPRYFGDIGYYAALAAHANVVIDRDSRYDKRQKNVHRCVIADRQRPLNLTVPITKPAQSSLARWSDVKVSRHGQWWKVHYSTLCTAYGRTPFFEFYINRFLPFLQDPENSQETSLADLDIGIDCQIREILGIESNVTYEMGSSLGGKIKDFRKETFKNIDIAPYYQLGKPAGDFIPNLSILDLIFNMGYEAPLILKKTIELNSFP